MKFKLFIGTVAFAMLVLSQYIEATYAMELLAESAEGVGYLLKDRVSDVNEFADAVRRVGEGGSALDPTIVSQLVVTDRAVEKHVTSIFSKLRLPAASEDHRRVLAVLAYLRS